MPWQVLHSVRDSKLLVSGGVQKVYDEVQMFATLPNYWQNGGVCCGCIDGMHHCR